MEIKHIVYFKSSNDYGDIRYFTCINYNKKSKRINMTKMYNSRIIINLVKKEAYISRLYSNECIEFMFGSNIIIPSINKEIKKEKKL